MEEQDAEGIAAASAMGPTATPLGPAAAGDSYMESADNTPVAEQVKRRQRESPDVRSRWAEHCGTYFKGDKDPYRHNEASLRFFLDLHSFSCGTCDRCNPQDFNFRGGCGSRLRKQ